MIDKICTHLKGPKISMSAIAWFMKVEKLVANGVAENRKLFVNFVGYFAL